MRLVLPLVAVLSLASPAVAQTADTASGRDVTSAAGAGTLQRPPPAGQPARGGFTFLVNLGLGIQRDGGFEKTAIGLAGLNFGVGGFLNEKTALLFRLSGTNVTYDFSSVNDVRQVSGVLGPTLQYWVTDRFTLEGGIGFGLWSIEGEGQRGPGLILGAGTVLLQNGRHNVHVGVEYAPAFTDAGTVNNVGINLGYQFHRR